MVFKAWDTLTEEEKAALRKEDGRLRFTPKGSVLQGVLDLDLELSAVRLPGVEHEEHPAPDQSLKALALPVPVKDDIEAPNWRLRVLPGAPLAFIRAQQQEPPFVPIPDLQADAFGLGNDWFNQYGDFRRSVIEEVEHYFKEEATGKFRSVVSFALRKPNQQREILGVLNLHSDQPGILRTGGPATPLERANSAEQFSYLIDPILSNLSELLDLLVGLYRSLDDAGT
jgi:hypothetical protein